MSYFRRTSRSRFWKVALLLLGLLLTLDFIRLSRSGSRQHQNTSLSIPVPTPSIYIASIFWNSAYILHISWNRAILDLVEELGGAKIYISIYESGSWDHSKQVLKELESALIARGIPHRIILDDTTHADDIGRPPTEEGWIKTPRGKTELRRIPYLSRLRNKTLEPLAQLAANGTTFDKVKDVWALLETNDGDYAAACSLDFSKPPEFYDTFALRDTEGHERLSMTFPYFRSRKSRWAMVSHRPVPVSSCWNGMVAFDSSPFYQKNPLRFRGISDSLASHHLEGSECCLIHADNFQSKTKGIWLNPSVRVGYDPEAYNVVHALEPWPSISSRWAGLWRNRVRRWVTTVWFKEWVVRNRLKTWSKGEPGRHEPGEHCIINEMQVLIHNGWAHV
ncbi:hypothetical protein ACLMJK_003970 [Lecanora helva]